MTLIEVLISSVILFMAIGLVSSVFQQSLMLQSRLKKEQFRHEMLYWTKNAVQFELEKGSVGGDVVVDDLKVSYIAEEIAKNAFVDSYSNESEGTVTGRGYMVLYRIQISSESLSTSYQQSIWTNSL